MSWHFLPEVEGGSSAERSSVGRPLQRSRSTRSAGRCYCDDRSTACSPCSQSGTTRGHSMAGRGVGWWMSCLQASRASRSAWPGKDSAMPMNATSGPRPHESLARYDLGSHSWRTRQGSLLPIETHDASSDQPTWERFWGPWPSWGTLRSGVCWERITPALPTNGTACGFWPSPTTRPDADNRGSNKVSGPKNLQEAARLGRPTWPTPTSSRTGDWTQDGDGTRRASLQGAAKTWPTPRSEDSQCAGVRHSRGVADTLYARVCKWPTPRASEWKGTGPVGSKSHAHRLAWGYLDATVAEAESRGGTGTRRTWRSPQARDHRNARAPGKWQSGERQPGLNDQVADKTAMDTATRNGQLNPDWVEWLMGLPGGIQVTAYTMGPVRLLVGHEPQVELGPLLWHMSVSCEDRLPTWDELMEARKRVLPPEAFFVMLIPPREYWLNLHAYCLHLWETTDPALIAHMKANALVETGG